MTKEQLIDAAHTEVERARERDDLWLAPSSNGTLWPLADTCTFTIKIHLHI